jgi:hypothetical protein
MVAHTFFRRRLSFSLNLTPKHMDHRFIQKEDDEEEEKIIIIIMQS